MSDSLSPAPLFEAWIAARKAKTSCNIYEKHEVRALYEALNEEREDIFYFSSIADQRPLRPKY